MLGKIPSPNIIVCPYSRMYLINYLSVVHATRQYHALPSLKAKI